MPKGGDLHNHLSGAVYAESYIRFAAQDGLCIDRQSLALFPPATKSTGNDTAALSPPGCDEASGRLPMAQALNNPVLYRQAIDAMSMRHFAGGKESGHDHFFDAFAKFALVARAHTGEMVAEVVSRAADQHELYLELITGLVPQIAMSQGSSSITRDDFESLRVRLLPEMQNALSQQQQKVDHTESQWHELLACGTANALPGCKVKVRYIYEVYRGFPPAQVFAMTLAGFELAKTDPRIVALNFVMPEDGYVSIRDYTLHMEMVDFMHKLYPQVHISLHAGELAPGLVPPAALRFHIRQAVELGHAQRIGHGVDVMWEENPLDLLKELATKKVLVEICLTSNDEILAVRGKAHPLPQYMKYGVPVSIATDDEGVARSDITRELQKAIETFGLHYSDLKQMERQSLEHAFLPGESLWADVKHARRKRVCARENSPSCSELLRASEKASLQEQLEKAFRAFESKY